MRNGNEWKGRNAVGEMPSGTCAVEGVLEELPLYPADPDRALTLRFG